MRWTSRAVFGDEADKLRIFGNALRDFLDLEPLYESGRWGNEKTTEERFAASSGASWPSARRDASGMTRRLSSGA